MSKKRGNNSYDHAYHIKKIEKYSLKHKGVVAILEIMKTFELDYDCDLYKVTKKIENFYPRVKEQSKLGIEYTSEVRDIIKFIKKNELLERK